MRHEMEIKLFTYVFLAIFPTAFAVILILISLH
jgi:hypothetical protein